ncbi:MAG: hypothetical protein P9M13_08870 [Candidatus Ancaeobacter aquaticus]|nr:hypothetical protein [Candidatus Ancaeobacter aquaticus]
MKTNNNFLKIVSLSISIIFLITNTALTAPNYSPQNGKQKRSHHSLAPESLFVQEEEVRVAREHAIAWQEEGMLAIFKNVFNAVNILLAQGVAIEKINQDLGGKIDQGIKAHKQKTGRVFKQHIIKERIKAVVAEENKKTLKYLLIPFKSNNEYYIYIVRNKEAVITRETSDILDKLQRVKVSGAQEGFDVQVSKIPVQNKELMRDMQNEIALIKVDPSFVAEIKKNKVSISKKSLLPAVFLLMFMFVLQSCCSDNEQMSKPPQVLAKRPPAVTVVKAYEKRDAVKTDLTDETNKRSVFIDTIIIPSEAKFFNDVRLKGNMSCDNVQVLIEDEENQPDLKCLDMSLGAVAKYTANSKESVHIGYLLGVITQKPEFKNIHLNADKDEMIELKKRNLKPTNQNIASLRLLDKLKTHKRFGKLMPWVSITDDGTLTATTDFIPALDNGQTSWSLIAVLGVLEGSEDALSREIACLAKEVLGVHNYAPFYDYRSGLMFAEVNSDLSKRGGYKLSDMYEGTMAVLYGILHGQVPETAWDNLIIDTVEYTTQGGEVIDVLQGFRGSFHELWALGWLPYMDSSLNVLFKNFLYAQLDHARKHGLPGIGATCYTNKGYQQIGPFALASHRGKRQDVSTAYATAMTVLVDRQAGEKWFINLYKYPGMAGNYGIIESVAPDGYGNIFTTDSKGLILLSLSGGLNKEVTAYLKTHKVPGTDISMHEKLMELFERKYLQLMKKRNEAPIRTFSSPYPLPAKKQIQLAVKEESSGPAQFEIISVLQSEHHHGLYVDENWIHPAGGISIKYNIPRDAADKYAWKGTFISPVNIADNRYLSVTMPSDTPRYIFNIELKNSLRSFILAHAVIDTVTKEDVIYSKDGKKKTIVVRIYPIKKSKQYDCDYFAISIDDPKYKNVPFRGEFEISKIEISKNSPLTGMKPVKPLDKIIKLPGTDNVFPYITWPHGGLLIKKFGSKRTVSFKGRGWKGGYVAPPRNVGSKYAGGHVNIIVRNLHYLPSHFLLEMKNEKINLLKGGKYKVNVPAGGDWQVVQVPLPDNPDMLLNYIAIADVYGSVEIGGITFDSFPAGSTYALKVSDISPVEEKIPVKAFKETMNIFSSVPSTFSDIPDSRGAVNVKLSKDGTAEIDYDFKNNDRWLGISYNVPDNITKKYKTLRVEHSGDAVQFEFKINDKTHIITTARGGTDFTITDYARQIVVALTPQGAEKKSGKLNIKVSMVDKRGKDLAFPGIIARHEDTNRILKTHLNNEGAISVKINFKADTIDYDTVKVVDDKLVEGSEVEFALTPDFKTKMRAAVKLIKDNKVKTALPEGVTIDQLKEAIAKKGIFFYNDVTLGNDVFAHTGMQINMPIGMLMNASTEDAAKLLLEEAKHVVIDDPEHKIIKHDEGLRQRLLAVALTEGKRANAIAKEMADTAQVKAYNTLANSAIAKDAAEKEKMTVIYLAVDPDFMINLDREMKKRKGKKNFKIVPVYKESFMRAFEYLNKVSEEYKEALLPAVDVAVFNADYRTDKETLEDALINYAGIELDAKIKAQDIGLINSGNEKYRIPIEKTEKILGMVPKQLGKDEIYNVGSLLDVMEIGIMARRLAGANFDTLTFAELADYLEADMKGQFLAALKELNIAQTENVAKTVMAPVPIKGASEMLRTNVNSLRAIMIAA